MKNENEKETMDIEEGSDFISELAKYLDALSNDRRLKILKLLESGPKDIRTIGTVLAKNYGTVISQEAVNKHLVKLQEVGVIGKVPGIKDTGKGPRAVMNYVLIPGGIEAIIRSLGKFAQLSFELGKSVENVRKQMSASIDSAFPRVRVIGGFDDGTEFLIQGDSVNIGRKDPENTDKYDSEKDIVLSNGYKAVTRVSHPHARLTFLDSGWHIEDCNSANGTYIGNEKLEKNRKKKLKNGVMIRLGKGMMGARLVFNLVGKGVEQ